MEGGKNYEKQLQIFSICRSASVSQANLCGPHKKPGTLVPAEIIAVRRNGLRLRDIAFTLETKNQFLSLIKGFRFGRKTRCLA
jgi:hypothetical protein